MRPAFGRNDRLVQEEEPTEEAPGLGQIDRRLVSFFRVN